MKKKISTHGGPREGSGRKPGYKMPKEKLKESTVVMRVPESLVPKVEQLIEKDKKGKS